MASRRDVAIVEAYVRRYNRLRTTTGLLVGRLWDQYAGFDDGAAERFATAAASTVVAAQTATGTQVDGYLAALAGGTAEGLDPAAFTGAAVRNGADPLDVYLRSIIAARAAVGLKPFRDAMRLGRNRAVSSAETDVALAQRAAVNTSGATKYRRVLTGQSCALCATASTQRYHRGNLMPIHSHCDCGIAPILGSEDPGHVINRKLLNDIKQQGPNVWESRGFGVDDQGRVFVRDRSVSLNSQIEGPDRLWRQRKPVRFDVNEHGELGPVLTEHGHDFTSAADIAA